MRGAGPDRRADGDRRARRGRDRQRRPGAPRAARLARGDRGGQGRADRGPARRARRVVVPAGEPLLAPHLRADLRTITFGEGGDVTLRERRARRDGRDPRRAASEIALRPSFSQAHNLRNLLAAVAAARALGYTPRGRAGRAASRRCAASAIALRRRGGADRRLLQRQPDVHARGDRRPGRDGARRGAWRCSATCSSSGRRRRACTARSARTRRARGVELLVTVGPLGGGDARGASPARRTRSPTRAAAAELLAGCCATGDTVLVKGSRGVGPRARRARRSAAHGAGEHDAPARAGAGAGPGRR